MYPLAIMVIDTMMMPIWGAQMLAMLLMNCGVQIQEKGTIT